MNIIKTFKAEKWWRQANPAYRKACERLNEAELLELKGKYDYLMKHINKQINFVG